MKNIYALDTNAYALLFQSPKSEAGIKLEEVLSDNNIVTFYIPEIVSMEIHSVLGKYRRGGIIERREQCSRKIMESEKVIACSNTCYVEPRPRIKQKVYRALLKLLSDIEKKQGSIQAERLPLGSSEIGTGRDILAKYAHRFSFGSHDALVAGTVVIANGKGLGVTLVTSDKGLKAVCKEEAIPYFDPNKVE